MERLLVLRLETVGVVAEASLNGVVLARTSARRRAVTVPIHEYTLAGANEIELVIEPPPPGQPALPKALLSDGRRGASLRLLLPRIGQLAHPEYARTLAQIDWAPLEGDLTTTPHRRAETVDLPIAFPRWRYFDIPPPPSAQALVEPVAAWLQGIAAALARGDPEPLVQAARLRFEDLALAYQRSLADDVGRLRLQIQQLHAQAPLQPALPQPDQLMLRPQAAGRIFECLDAGGEPVLRSEVAGGGEVAWPLRVACIDERFYVVR